MGGIEHATGHLMYSRFWNMFLYDLGCVCEEEPFRKLVTADTVKIYIYFDDTVTGNVANVQLVDTDGDIVAQSDREFEKPPSKGLYVAFKYTIIEKETEVQIESE